MTTYNPPHYRDENIWRKIPETETERLQLRLSPHLKNMNVKKTKIERIQFVKEILGKQNNTCAFEKDVGGKWCWNESKVNFTKTKKKDAFTYKTIFTGGVKMALQFIKERLIKDPS